MEAIRKFKENVQRVRASKYADLENKDKALKASTTILKIALYGILIILAIPIVAGVFIAMALSNNLKEAGREYSQQRSFANLVKAIRRW